MILRKCLLGLPINHVDRLLDILTPTPFFGPIYKIGLIFAIWTIGKHPRGPYHAHMVYEWPLFKLFVIKTRSILYMSEFVLLHSAVLLNINFLASLIFSGKEKRCKK